MEVVVDVHEQPDDTLKEVQVGIQGAQLQLQCGIVEQLDVVQIVSDIVEITCQHVQLEHEINQSSLGFAPRYAFVVRLEQVLQV
jgi:hypothetical protein